MLFRSPFFLDLLAGMVRTGREFGYDTVVTNLSLSDAEEIEQLKREVTTGVILLATELSEEDMKQFDDCEAPLVVIDSWYDNMKYDSVLISNTDSVCQAVEYLFDKGHERVGYLKGTDRITNFYYRQLGFERAHQKRKKPLHSEYDVEIRPMADIAYQDMKQYLEGMKKKSEDLHTVLPTAYFADNDIIAIGALKALQEAGIRVPEDVSLIGFDDMPFCEMSSPKLTTIRVFKQEMGMIAVKRLLEHLAEAKVINTKIQVCTQFIERESVRKLP